MSLALSDPAQLLKPTTADSGARATAEHSPSSAPAAVVTVYVLGRYGQPWELEAVYSTEAEAIAACDEPDLFYVPMALGQRFESSAERHRRKASGLPPVDLPCVYPREEA